MTTKLHISDDLSLPLDLVTLATVVYGARGSGKTTFGAVLAEEAHRARQRFVAIDLKGDWYGLKSSADGRTGAIPVVIFGGDHADLPLEEGAGAVIGETVAGLAQSCVIDLELLSKGKQIRFLASFFAALYHHNREPLLVLADEAQRYAPQKTFDPDSAKCLGAVEDLVKLGRKHGIGVVVFTQRGAGLNKEVSELCDLLVAFRTPGPLDQDRIEAWLNANTTKDKRDAVMASLASLPTGTAVFASGHPDLKLFGTHAIRQRETFDSSATPKVGQRRKEPKQLAEPDLVALREKMSAAIERAKADDPRALRARIAELEKQLAQVAKAPPKVEQREVSVLTDKDRYMLGGLAKAWRETTAQHVEAIGKLKVTVEGVVGVIEKSIAKVTPPAPVTPASAPQVRARPAPVPRLGSSPLAELPSGVKLGKGPLAILRALAAFPSLTRTQAATHAGLSPQSGTFSNYLSMLRTGVYVVDNDGRLTITDAGRAIVGPVDVPMSTDDLITMWKSKFGSGPGRMLDALVAHRRDGLTRDELATAVLLSAESGTFSNYLSALHSNGLVEKRSGRIYASEALFLAGAA